MREEEFWDKISGRIEKEYSKVSEYESYIIRKLGNVTGQHILDCGIGGGRVSRFLAEQGAKVVGIDCSSAMLYLTRRKVPSALLLKMKVEELGFCKEQFDIIIGLYILHHTVLNETIPEIARVLKKGGIGIFVENFGFNPLLNFARKHLLGKFGTQRKGTAGEHPLNTGDLQTIRKHFREVAVETDLVFFARLLARSFEFKSKTLNLITDLFDRGLSKGFHNLRNLSYTQLLVIKK